MIRKTGTEGVAHPAFGNPTTIGTYFAYRCTTEIRDGWREGGGMISRAEERTKRYKYRKCIF
jgi:hypothetical protein